MLSQAAQAAEGRLRRRRLAHGGGARPRRPHRRAATRRTEGLQQSPPPPPIPGGQHAGAARLCQRRREARRPGRSASPVAPARGWAGRGAPAASQPARPPAPGGSVTRSWHRCGAPFRLAPAGETRTQGAEQGNMQPFWAEADKEPRPAGGRPPASPLPLRRPADRRRPHLRPRPAAPRRPPPPPARRRRRSAAEPLPPDSQLSARSHLPCLL